MITFVIKKTQEPTVVQLTRDNLLRELEGIGGAAILIEKTWKAGIKKTETPYVCLVEDDCVLSEGYVAINLGLMKQASTGIGNYRGGGYTKLAMMASAVGMNRFSECIYGFSMFGGEVICDTIRMSEFAPYHVQVGFVPGAIMRYASIKDADVNWDDPNLVRLSAKLSSYLWDTNRRIKLNPHTVYVSANEELDDPIEYSFPPKVKELFMKESI